MRRQSLRLPFLVLAFLALLVVWRVPVARLRLGLLPCSSLVDRHVFVPAYCRMTDVKLGRIVDVVAVAEEMIVDDIVVEVAEIEERGIDDQFVAFANPRVNRE